MSDVNTTGQTSSSTLDEEIISVIRVGAAAVAGFGVAQLVRLGVHVDQGLLMGVLTSVFSTGYYALSRYLAKHWPAAERLLLMRKP